MSRQVVRFIDRPGRYRLWIPFVKEGEEVEVLALVMAGGEGLFEFEIWVDHRVARTAGKVVIKAIVDGKARVRLAGTIKIAKDCPGVNDFLEMRALLLSDNAWAEAVPMLEIESADVKASHAAAVSRLSDDEIFYLQSRGLSGEEARRMLILGFIGEMIGLVGSKKTRARISKRLEQYGYKFDQE